VSNSSPDTPIASPPETDAAELPLYVDLDGTLIESDMLWESIARLLREQPLSMLLLPIWLLGGKAAFKARIAERARPDPRLLPYRPEVLQRIEAARAAGRRTVLASASHVRLTGDVAEHLQLFDAVLATDGETNVAGERKLMLIREDCDGATFEYMGNSIVDLEIWREAGIVTAVAPTPGAARGLAKEDIRHDVLVDAPPLLPELLRSLRPHQWVKNALLFAPILLAHQLANMQRLTGVLVAFAGFCAVASAGYVLNDLVDIEADRTHRSKRRRPIASGRLPIPNALGLLVVLLVAAALAGSFSTRETAMMLGGYLGLTLAYTFYFKQQLILDVVLLAGLYTFRVLAGGVAADVAVSPWLLAFSAFFFLSLALVKRYIELLGDRNADQPSLNRRAYRVDDISLVETMGLACAYISVLVLCLFVSSEDVTVLYDSPALLWLMCPVMFYWISRIWFLAHRGELDDDPVLFATTDPSSWVSGALVLATVAAATW
jgi:4-hydroxybenzoate polyprenyltransferase/phosphoserine phosphatase